MSAHESSTPLGRVRALGSSQEGGEHWIRERLTSLAMLLLGVWLIASFIMLPSVEVGIVREWLSSASGAVPMALLIVVAFVHAVDGMKVIIDDYAHDAGNNFFLNAIVLFAGVGGAALALFSLAKIAFGGAA